MVLSAQNAEGAQGTSESHLDQGHYCTGTSRLLEKDTPDRKSGGKKTPLWVFLTNQSLVQMYN